LKLGGAVLLLAICSGFSFQLYYLADKGFLLLLLFLCVCRVCLLLVRTKLFCLMFFKGLSFLFLVKLVDLSQYIYIYIYFFFLSLLLPIGNFCCWDNILGFYIVFLDFRSTNFFMDFKKGGKY